MNEGILASLRAGTKDAHARLEQYVDIPSRAGDPQRYATLLKCFFGWYEPMERALAAVGDWSSTGYPRAERTKLHWLENDLRALGLTPEELAALPRCADLPRVDLLAHGFGCAYVMEGATLGGRVITGMLKGSIPEESRRFFRAYGEETREKWLQFVAVLEAFAQQRGGDEAIVTAATESFESLEKWLRQCDAAQG